MRKFYELKIEGIYIYIKRDILNDSFCEFFVEINNNSNFRSKSTNLYLVARFKQYNFV